MHKEYPKLVRDQFWTKKVPNLLPYTLASERFMTEYPSHSTRDVKVKPNEAEMYTPDERRVYFQCKILKQHLDDGTH